MWFVMGKQYLIDYEEEKMYERNLPYLAKVSVSKIFLVFKVHNYALSVYHGTI